MLPDIHVHRWQLLNGRMKLWILFAPKDLNVSERRYSNGATPQTHQDTKIGKLFELTKPQINHVNLIVDQMHLKMVFRPIHHQRNTVYLSYS